ncbi:MAG: beta-lactamase family protein [Muribaculaceae bacterium]|nr:beta-lactamase family protein [Muribaculaceae bacterium]
MKHRTQNNNRGRGDSRRRKSRKSGRRTAMVLLSVIVAGAVVFAVAHRGCSDSPVADETEAFLNASQWSDTLTNAASELALLRPMDKEIETFMARHGIKGMQVAMMSHDSLLYAKGYGWADKERREKMTPTSMMRIASASKLITAIAVMRMVEEGRMRLDSKVFGPDGILSDSIYTRALGDKRMLDITVDHLLLHRGGFGRGGGDPMFSMKDIVKNNGLKGAPGSERLASLVLRRRLAYEPGNGSRYSNFGYLLLSLIIEKLSGQPYWEYVDSAVLRPAGAANFRSGTNYYNERHFGEVKYYGPDSTPVEAYDGSGRMVERVYGGNDIKGLKGAGGWIASAPDLLRVVSTIDGYGAVPDILSAGSVAVMTQTAEDEKENLARGWAEIEDDGSWVRTGTLSSSHAYVRMFPDGRCWAVLTNSGNWRGARFSRDLARLVTALNERYAGKMPERNLW